MMDLSLTLSLSIGMMAFAFIFRSGRKRSKTPSEVGVSDAWDYYFTHAESLSERDRNVLRLVAEKIPEARLAQIKDSIEEFEVAAEAVSRPLRPLREAIMEATDQFVLAEALDDAETAAENGTPCSPAYLESVIRAGVLRCYGNLKFRDFGERDWYTHYLGLCEMNVRNVAGMIQKTTQGDSATLETTLHEPMTASMSLMRELLLDYPPATPVENLDLSTRTPPAPAQGPSEEQMRELVQLMENRFQRLFNGKLYHWLDGPSVNPGEAFNLDGGLLLAQLSSRYSNARTLWAAIIEKALRSVYGGSRVSAADLEHQAREYEQIWRNQGKDGALFAVLRKAAPRTFPRSASQVSATAFDPEVLSLKMSDDAISLIRGIHRILKEE